MHKTDHLSPSIAKLLEKKGQAIGLKYKFMKVVFKALTPVTMQCTLLSFITLYRSETAKDPGIT
jgi:uncharacterized membrane protein (DUF106 family)